MTGQNCLPPCYLPAQFLAVQTKQLEVKSVQQFLPMEIAQCGIIVPLWSELKTRKWSTQSSYSYHFTFVYHCLTFKSLLTLSYDYLSNEISLRKISLFHSLLFDVIPNSLFRRNIQYGLSIFNRSNPSMHLKKNYVHKLSRTSPHYCNNLLIFDNLYLCCFYSSIITCCELWDMDS